MIDPNSDNPLNKIEELVGNDPNLRTRLVFKTDSPVFYNLHWNEVKNLIA